MSKTEEKTQPSPAAQMRAQAAGTETQSTQPTAQTARPTPAQPQGPQPSAAELRREASGDVKPPSTPSTPNAKATVSGTPSPALAGLRSRANAALDLTHSILQEATALSQHTGPAPAGFGAELRELSDTLHRAEKQAESAKKFLRLASDLSKTRPKA